MSDTEKIKVDHEGTSTARNHGSTFREWAVDNAGIFLVGYLAAFAVLANPIGFITLSIQLMVYYEFGYWMSLQVAQLVPTALVVGKVAAVFFFSLMTNAAVGGLCVMVWEYKSIHKNLHSIPGNPLGLEDPDNPIGDGKTTLGQYLFTMQRYAMIVILLMLPTMIFPLILTSWFNAGIYAVYIALIVVGSYAIAPSILDAVNNESRTQLYKSMAVAYAVSLLVAIPLVGLGSPSLPTAEIVSEEQKLEVDILSHSDGYWHVINQKTLTSIPDDEVDGDVKITGVVEKPGY